MRHLIFIILALSAISCNRSDKGVAEDWTTIFNGKDLEGWTVKITGYPAGENFNNTFRVVDSVLKVSYDEYDSFNGEFGHIFYNNKLSDYKLRLEYRFTGEQAEGGPGWAFRNSGIMLHCQEVSTMNLDQDFPVSIEAQFLGGDGVTERPTLNLCTPGTNVVIDGELVTRHCTESSSKTFHGDQWVTAEVVVYSDSLIHHIVNGDTVITYNDPQVGGELPDGFPLPEGTLLDGGYISLQAESHPVEFRNIKLKMIKR